MSAAIPKPEKVTVAGLEVDVWHLDLDALNEDRAAETILSQDEVHRAQQFREERDRARWTSGRVALRRILSGYCETEPDRVRFAYNEFGKPAFAESGPDALPSFNMSRAGQFALCAVARCGALGVDLQRVPDAPAYESLARNYCAAQEQRLLEQVPAPQRQSALCQLWAYKEAYLKARGTGFSIEPDEVIVDDFLNGRATLVRSPGEQELKRWHLVELKMSPGYRAALALTP